MRIVIAGTGYALPERVVANSELVREINTTEEFIVERTGVQTRRHVDPSWGLAELAVPAAKQAVEQAGLQMNEIDLLILNTLSPDHHDPSEACFIHPLLGLPNIPAFDIRAQCSGFLYALDISTQYLRSGRCRNVLIVCAEILSKRLDPSDDGRNLAILLGDGAGAAVIRTTADASDGGLLDLIIGADGKHYKHLWTEAPGSRNRHFIDAEDIAQNKHLFRMTGRPMFEHATQTLVGVAREILEKNKLALSDLDVIIPHQPNLRILDAVREELGIPEELMVISVDRLGNMASASLPVTLALAREQGRIPEHGLVLLLAYGAGATWGAALYRA